MEIIKKGDYIEKGISDRKFVAYFFWQGWNEISLGVSVDIQSPNIEIHIPFGFLKIGWERTWNYIKSLDKK